MTPDLSVSLTPLYPHVPTKGLDCLDDDEEWRSTHEMSSIAPYSSIDATISPARRLLSTIDVTTCKGSKYDGRKRVDEVGPDGKSSSGADGRS